jgi:hypothetical protein
MKNGNGSLQLACNGSLQLACNGYSWPVMAVLRYYNITLSAADFRLQLRKRLRTNNLQTTPRKLLRGSRKTSVYPEATNMNKMPIQIKPLTISLSSHHPTYPSHVRRSAQLHFLCMVTVVMEMNTDMRRLTTGIRSENFVVGNFVVVRTSYSVLTQT